MISRLPLSLLLPGVLFSMEPYTGSLDEEKKVQRADIVEHINKHARSLKRTSSIIADAGYQEVKKIQPVEHEESHRESISGLSLMVEAKENEVQQKNLRRALEDQDRRIKTELSMLERDVYDARNFPASDGEASSPKMVVRLSKSDGAPMDRDIQSKLKEMELALGVMENQKRLEDERVAQFKAKIEEVEGMLNDMLVEIEKLNGKERAHTFRNSEFREIVEDDRDFDEISKDMNRKVFFGEE